jgi:hypothetical protein
VRERVPIGLVIAVFLVIAIVVSLRFAPPIDWNLFRSAEAVRSAPSDLYASLDIRYDRPPIVDERYVMEDRNGVSNFAYTILRAAGPHARIRETIKVPPTAMYAVSFFFGELVNDGVWDVPTRVDRGDASIEYTVTVRQTEDYHSGSHVASFTDPHYWATSAGHEFQIHLSPKGPLPNLLQLQGTSVRDPRYQEILNDFLGFGPSAFRAAIARARSQAHVT